MSKRKDLPYGHHAQNDGTDRCPTCGRPVHAVFAAFTKSIWRHRPTPEEGR